MKLEPNLDTNLTNMQRQREGLHAVIKRAQASIAVLDRAIGDRVSLADRVAAVKTLRTVVKYPPYCITPASKVAYLNQMKRAARKARKG